MLESEETDQDLGCLLSQSLFAAVRKVFPVVFHNLEDLPPHLAVFGEDVAVLCGHSNCPLTTVIHNFDS